MLQVAAKADPRSSGATIRLELDAAFVQRAVAEAESGTTVLQNYADTQVRGLVLRVRGRSISWLVKTKHRTSKVGSPPATSLRAARKAANIALAKLAIERSDGPASQLQATTAGQPETIAWTWSRLSAEYRTYVGSAKLKKGRIRPPSQKSVTDVKQCFDRKALESWQTRPITELTVDDLDELAEAVRALASYRQAEKVVCYVKAALRWCLRNKRRESGLRFLPPGWAEYAVSEPTGREIEAIVARRRPTGNEKFDVRELGRVLARHEDFCRGRTGRDRISPGVRWGLWWDALTVSRRGAAMMLEKARVVWNSPHVPEGWILVWWPAESVKARKDFWLPVPPFGVHLLRRMDRDWRSLIDRSHGTGHTSKWAFPSTRRCGRVSTDVVTTGDALANHLANMRGKRDGGHRNHLEGIPHFSVHTFRSVASTLLVNEPELPPGAASALLGHALPGDDEPGLIKLSPTTEQFYSFAQRIPLKVMAMRRWSEALLDAYKAAGGLYPE